MKRYILNGDPIPLARPRFTKRDTEVTVYDSQRQLKLVSQLHLSHQHAGAPPFTGPLILHVFFFFKIPNNKKNVYALGDPHTKKPDLSNIVKYIEDVCQYVGIINDDSCIYQINAQKKYDYNSRTEFYFEEYDEKK